MAEDTPVSMLLVMGVTGTGKSSFINKLAGREAVKVSQSVFSCTSSCKGVPATIGKTRTLLIDTPGFDDSIKSDSEVLADIGQMLTAQRKANVKLHGVLYLHRITDDRYGGKAMKTLEIFRDIVGDLSLKNVILVTTRWETVDAELGPKRESEIADKIWRDMIDRGATMARYYGDVGSARGFATQLLNQDSVVLALQRELLDENKDLLHTAAGSRVNEENQKLKIEYESKLRSFESERRLMLEKDKAERAEIQMKLEKDRKELEELLEKTRIQQATLGQNPANKVRNRWRYLERTLDVLAPALNIISEVIGLDASATDLLQSWFGGS